MLIQDKEMILDFLAYCEIDRELSENTIKNYKSDLNHMFNNMSDYKTITRSDLMRYIRTLNLKMSPASVIRKIATIQTLWTWLVDMEYVDKNITHKLPRPNIKPKEAECPEKEEIEAIIKQLNKKNRDDLALAVEIASFVGLRAEEVIEIEFQNIDFNNRIIKLIDTKTKQSESVFCDSKTLESIKQYCDRHEITNGVVIRTSTGNPYRIHWFMKNVKKNIKQEIGFGFHSFRKSCATMINEKAGIKQAQVQMRHSDIKTTQKYVKVRTGSIQNTLEAIR